MRPLRRLIERAMPELQRAHVVELGWIIAGQAGAVVATLATMKFLTSVLSPAIFGTFNLVLIGTILPSWLLLSPLIQALLRWYAPYNEKGTLGDLFFTILIAYAAVTTITSSLGVILIVLGLGDVYGLEPYGALLLVGIFFVESWTSLALAVPNAARERRVVAIASAAAPWMRVGFMALGIQLFESSLTVVLGGYLLGSAGTMLYTLSVFMREVRRASPGTFRPSLLRSMLTYGLPFGIWSVFAWAQQYADRYVVDVALGAATAGTYIVTLQIASLPFSLLGGLLGQFLGPIVYQRAGDGTDPRRVDAAKSICVRISVVFLVGGLVIAGLLGLAGNWLVKIVANERYVIDSAWICSVFALGALITVLAQQFTLLMLAQNRSGAVLWAKMVPTIVGLPIVLVLTKSFGVLGSAIGFALTALMLLCTVLFAAGVFRDAAEPIHDALCTMPSFTESARQYIAIVTVIPLNILSAKSVQHLIVRRKLLKKHLPAVSQHIHDLKSRRIPGASTGYMRTNGELRLLQDVARRCVRVWLKLRDGKVELGKGPLDVMGPNVKSECLTLANVRNHWYASEQGSDLFWLTSRGAERMRV